jgi:type III pantothenate kinase
MLLAIDIGNTHTVIGIYRQEKLVADWRMASLTHRTADENWLTLKSFCADADIDTTAVKAVGISSVVPDLTFVFEHLARKHFGVEPVTISGSLDFGIGIHYRDPSAVGADRLCDAVAGFEKYGGPLIIIDFGTATTYDVISKEGDYLGGVITLGLESTAAELHRRAAKLPRIELRFPPSTIGFDTASSIQAGVLFGTVDAAVGIVKRIRLELGAPARVIATGGLAKIIAAHTPIIEAVEPSLVLDGIRLILERLERKQRLAVGGRH